MMKMNKRIWFAALLLLGLILGLVGTTAASSAANGTCLMTVQLPADLQAAGAKVDINYGPQNLGHGDTFTVTSGANFQWRLDVNGFNSGWKTTTGNCGTTLNVTSGDYCDMEVVGLPSGARVDINYGPQNLVNGDTVILPQGINIQWRVDVNGFNGTWNTKSVDCSALDASDSYCNTLITGVPAGARVDISYGPQNLVNGDIVTLPKGIQIRWRLEANGFNGPLQRKDVDCTPLDASGTYCEMQITGLPSTARVDINYGPQNLVNGDTVVLPTGINIQWRVEASGFNGVWHTKNVDCSDLVVTTAHYCDMLISMSAELAKTGARVDINYGPQNLTNGDSVVLPVGITIQWRLEAGGSNSSWMSKYVDCTSLVPDPKVSIKMPAGVYIYIENLGYFQDGDTFSFLPTKTYRYKLYDSTKKVSTGWKTKVFSAADNGKTWDLTGEFCHMEIDLDGSDGYVYIENVGYFEDGDTKWVPGGATFRYKAYDSTKKVSTDWENKTVDCTALKPGFCNMGIDLDGGDGWVYIENVGYFKHGDTKWVPGGATFRYKAYDSTTKVSTGWNTKTVDCTALKPGFCNMEIDLDDGDGYVYIENVGYFADGDYKWVPGGASFRYKAYDSTKKISTDWKDKDVDCSALKPGFCNMEIDLDGGDGHVYIENVGYFADGDYKWVPGGATFRYKAYDSTQKISTGWKDKQADCSALKPGYCDMAIDLDGGDGYVYIENVGYFAHGDHKWVPGGATFRYKAYDSTQKISTDWKDKEADCTALKPGYCDMAIDLDGGDGYVYIENVGYFAHGDHKWVPGGATFRYKAYDSTKKISTGWNTKNADCSALKPGYCHMQVNFDAKYWDKVYIENVGYFYDGDYKWVPLGVSFRFKAYDKTGSSTPWITKDADCSPLVAKAVLNVKLPDGTWMEIYGVGWFQNGDTLELEPGKAYKYRLANANKYVRNDWKNVSFVAADYGTTWDLTPEFCEMSIVLPLDTWVEIYGVGWYQDGTKLWMPSGAVIQYRGTNANKYVRADWDDKTIDCTPLKPEFCELEIVLPLDTWVEIYGVGWYQNGAKLSMPTGAKIQYRGTNANKYVRADWADKTIDCTPLAPEFCEMSVILPADTWVEIYGVGWYQDGTKLWMPTGAKIQYRGANANKYVRADWADKEIDCTPLTPSFCELEIQLPDDTWVEIYGVGWYQDGAKLSMPTGAKIQYRGTNANKYVRANWAYKQIDCTPLVPAFCNMEINLEAGGFEKLEIYGVGWFNHGDKAWMPTGAKLQYRASDATGARTGWEYKEIDCSPLVPECLVNVVLPDSTWVEVSGVGWFSSGDQLKVLPLKTYRYRVWNSAKTVAGPWKDKGACTAADCGGDWNLTPEFCNMAVNLGSSDGWVEVSGVGWFQGGSVWLPKEATVRYRLWNSAKTVAGPWKDKPVDCTPLAVGDEFCNMAIDLGSSDGWVEVSGVGWFQGGSVWLPKEATVRYRLWNSAKTVSGPWQDKPVDCSPLAVGAEFCNMAVDLGSSDGWVEVSGVGWFQGGSVWLPKEATVRYRLWNSAKTVSGPWENKPVDCTPLAVGADFCLMEIDIAGDEWVEISGVGWFQDGAKVWLPMNATVRYRVWDAAKTTSGPWQDKNVDCTDLVVT